ncbi:MAG: hypothetical protein WBP64_10230 [Nitrososphaeraceae archaeon]
MSNQKLNSGRRIHQFITAVCKGEWPVEHDRSIGKRRTGLATLPRIVEGVDDYDRR